MRWTKEIQLFYCHSINDPNSEHGELILVGSETSENDGEWDLPVRNRKRQHCALYKFMRRLGFSRTAKSQILRLRLPRSRTHMVM